MTKPKIIFFGNGELARVVLERLEQSFEVIFHAKTREDLEVVKEVKAQNPEAFGILASFGALIKPDLLELFEPVGILNVHPSLLPDLRGPSPIETAILRGDTEFSVSIMKLAKEMDAGPIYFQTTITPKNPTRPDLKAFLYQELGSLGAKYLCDNLLALPESKQQNSEQATFCQKLDKKMSFLSPETETAKETLTKILAFQGFPKPKYTFKGKNCIILVAHIAKQDETALLPLKCADGEILSIDRLQPENKRPMDAKSFLNGLQNS